MSQHRVRPRKTPSEDMIELAEQTGVTLLTCEYTFLRAVGGCIKMVSPAEISVMSDGFAESFAITAGDLHRAGGGLRAHQHSAYDRYRPAHPTCQHRGL